MTTTETAILVGLGLFVVFCVTFAVTTPMAVGVAVPVFIGI